jgi:hypothetical protein
MPIKEMNVFNKKMIKKSAEGKNGRTLLSFREN